MHERLRTWFASARLKSWRWPELPVLIALLSLAACGWLFVELADQVVSGETHHFDQWAIESLRNPDDPRLPVGPRWLVDAARDITALGSTTVLTVVVTIAAGFLLLAGRPWLVVLLLAAVLSGSAVNLLLKSSFDRPRPPDGSALQGTRTSSFPSGHSLSAALVYLTLGAMLARPVPGHRLRVYLIVVALILALLVGASRVYLGVHYPTDVLAGWSVGAAWALVWWLIARVLAEREPAKVSR